MESIQEKIARLESEIEALPVRYISQKNIRGKMKKYCGLRTFFLISSKTADLRKNAYFMCAN